MNTYYLGLDIGGTKCAVVLGNEEIEIIEREEIPTDHTITAKENIEHMLKICERYIKKYKDSGIFKSVGVSCGGPLDDKNGVILSPPNLPGWDEIPITSIIEDRLKIPAFLQNDANACAVAEWKKGAGAGCKNMVFFTFGTGLGAGMILDGHLYSGTNGMAGEAGHIRLSTTGPIGYGKEGSFEGYCSGGGIKDICRFLSEKRMPEKHTVVFDGKEYPIQEVNAKIIFDAAKKGDWYANEIVNLCAEYLGRGLAVIVDILNPERIILGSIFVRGEELLRKRMEEYLEKEALKETNQVCRVVAAKLGESLGDVAALSVAVYGMENEYEQKEKFCRYNES